MMRRSTHEAELADQGRTHRLAVEALQGKVAELEVLLMACGRRLGSRVRLSDELLTDTGKRFSMTLHRDERARKPGLVLTVGLPQTGPFSRGPA
jgi:hypothetical protein